MVMCSRCHKRVAVVFIRNLQGGEEKQEGFCVKCARELGIKPIDDIIAQTGLDDETIERLNNEMQSLIDEGLSLMESVENKNEKLERLINLGKFITHSITTGLNAKKMFVLRNKMRVVESNDELNKVLDDMEAVVKAEIKNAEETIPVVEVDSRLGWEPSMEYVTDREHIEWKIKACEYTLNSEIETLRNVTKL